MPLYFLYRNKKCGSTARGINKWEKKDLIALCENFGLSTLGTITELCQRLIDYDQIRGSPPKHEPSPKSKQNREPQSKQTHEPSPKSKQAHEPSPISKQTHEPSPKSKQIREPQLHGQSKRSELINLKVVNREFTKDDNKQLIINVLTQLVAYTKQLIDKTEGNERRKNQFRQTQFKKAIRSISQFNGVISSGTQAQNEITGVGKGIGDRIDEILQTGTLSELTTEISQDPHTRLVNELMTVTGIGDKTAQSLINQGVTGIDDLRHKVESGAVKLVHHAKIGLKYYEDFQQRIPHQEITEIKHIMDTLIAGFDPNIIVEVCGSYRRELPTSGDLDVLITHPKIISDDDLITSPIHYLKEIVAILHKGGLIVDDLTTQGDTKYMGVCKHPAVNIGRRIDIRFVPVDSYYPAVLYFTGSMQLNRIMRSIALNKGYTLNEYGLYKNTHNTLHKIVVHSEREIFDILGIEYLTPIERELT